MATHTHTHTHTHTRTHTHTHSDDDCVTVPRVTLKPMPESSARHALEQADKAESDGGRAEPVTDAAKPSTSAGAAGLSQTDATLPDDHRDLNRGGASAGGVGGLGRNWDRVGEEVVDESAGERGFFIQEQFWPGDIEESGASGLDDSSAELGWWRDFGDEGAKEGNIHDGDGGDGYVSAARRVGLAVDEETGLPMRMAHLKPPRSVRWRVCAHFRCALSIFCQVHACVQQCGALTH